MEIVLVVVRRAIIPLLLATAVIATTEEAAVEPEAENVMSAPDLMKAWQTDKNAVISKYGGKRLTVFGYSDESKDDKGFSFKSDVVAFGEVSTRNGDRVVVDCELWGLQFQVPTLTDCRKSDHQPARWPTLDEALDARYYEPEYETETVGPHAGKVTRDAIAIENLDMTGVWAVMAARPGRMPMVAGYIWFYPDGTTALRDAGTCRITDSGAWEYANSMLTLIDDDGAQHMVTVIGVPAAPERKWGQRLVFDAGGFWEFVNADYERDC